LIFALVLLDVQNCKDALEPLILCVRLSVASLDSVKVILLSSDKKSYKHDVAMPLYQILKVAKNLNFLCVLF